ncbi:Pickpocket protein 28 [Frankliniella fusca]|uniref:Pickpocket protein 28 n=1 Tax=Frankliniella fusca TaxID=407009 RepID=A0AAE1GYV7_9NEOP|nr:Pickpocket protein 28 [Frankliniella fusca]
MKDTTFTTIGRTESYSQPEFLADCGGLLCLFSGFSLITLVEAFFHLVVRWWCHTFRKRRLSRLNSIKIALY